MTWNPAGSGSATPSGPAAGDLAGTYPNPTVKASVGLTGAPTGTTAAASDNSTKLASTAYVTTAIANALAGVNPAVAVRVATAAVLPNTPVYANGAAGIGATLTTATLNAALVVDGVTPALGDRVLVKNQAAALQNGVYTVTQLAAVGLAWILTRAADYNQPSDINSTGAIPVVAGTANATTTWVITSTVTTVGTDALTYAQFSYSPTQTAAFVRAGGSSIVVGNSSVTVVFSAAVASANYRVTVAPTVATAWRPASSMVTLGIESKTVNGFDLVIRVPNSGALTAVTSNDLTFDYVAVANV